MGNTVGMTHVQQIFVNNLRFYRTKSGLTQTAFSEEVGLTPNYLNAIENGKNFPSVDSLQRMIDALHILPYQLFLEHPDDHFASDKSEVREALQFLKQKLIQQCDEEIEKRSD